MRLMVACIGFALWAALLAAGCNQLTAQPQPSPTPAISPTAEVTVPEGASGQVDRARADLATRLGIAQEDITLVQSERVDWPSTALGCPRTGEMYAQVITPGYRIVLAAEGNRYQYNADESDRVILCEQA
jgi:hypothetical protein